MALVLSVSVRDSQDPHKGRMDFPVVNVQTAEAGQEALSLQASMRRVSFPLKLETK